MKQNLQLPMRLCKVIPPVTMETSAKHNPLYPDIGTGASELYY